MRARVIVVAVVTAVLFAGLLPPGAAVHDFVVHTTPPPTCDAAALASFPQYSLPLVKQRWDRASLVAPNVCSLPPGGAVWECYYSERISTDGTRLCWWPIPGSLPGDAPTRLDVLVDIGLLRRLAQIALDVPQVQELLGGGGNDIEVRADDDAALLHVEAFEITEWTGLTPPTACTPFDAPATPGAPSDARGVCASPLPPRPGACRFVQRPADADAYLCWWGRSSLPSADYVIETSTDTLRGILNAEDSTPVTKWALKEGYLTIWASDLVKRGTIKGALEFAVGEVPDPLPPIDSTDTQFKLHGRLFDVTYFPRDGVLTPCARDGQGTWFWLNGFGAPNGFVGSSTIRAMQLYLEEHGQLPSPDDVLDDLLLNYRPGEPVATPEGPGTVTYVFAPGSPFALIPVAQGPQGGFFALSGSGEVGEALPTPEATATAGRIAAAKAVTKDVDFNRQPGTLSQDLRFLRYAIERSPAAPQIETVLKALGNGIPPAEAEIQGMFPPEAPRIAPGANLSLPAAIAAGDAFLLGMGSHTLVWQDLVAHGAIQPTDGDGP